jgi:ABC-2 type transport system permease protein
MTTRGIDPGLSNMNSIHESNISPRSGIRDPVPHTFSFFRTFMSVKWKIANNAFSSLRYHKWIHIAFGLLIIIMLMIGGTALFLLVFRFMMDQPVFGPTLMNRLIKMVLLAFFSMLIFSNFIIMLTTTYISKEVEFLMSNPILHRSLFHGKLAESIVYSSWAFVILSLPFFTALGYVRVTENVSVIPYYLGTAIMATAYLIIPATIGAIMALLITALFPPRQMIRLTLVMLLVGIGGALATKFISSSNLSQMISDPSTDNTLPGMMRIMGLGDMVFLPSSWFGRGLVALEDARWAEAGKWLLALWSTALMGLVVCDWLAGPLYYRGWCHARSSGRIRSRQVLGLYQLFDRTFRIFPGSTRALLSKDLAIFWRDPGQWGQLMMLFGLLLIYMLYIPSAMSMHNFAMLDEFWQSLLRLFNIGTSAFILSILTTRFVFPLLSLEGRQQWVIGLAPVNRTHLVWEKFFVSMISALVITLPLTLVSCFMLKTDAWITGLSVLNICFMSLSLSGLAVGLGARLPNFVEDNPSRIANGLGGTMNAVLSMAYIGMTLLLESPWVYAYIHRTIPETNTEWGVLFMLSIPLWMILQSLVLILPMKIGLGHWRRMEF